LVHLLAKDAVFYGDGGGKVTAAPHPVQGGDRVARLLHGLFNKGRTLGGRVRRVDVNGQPGAMFIDTTDRLIGVMELDIVDGAVQSVRTIVNPDKLQHLGPVSDILRRYSNPESGKTFAVLVDPAEPSSTNYEDFPMQHSGIFKDRFVAPNVGCCFGVFDRQRSDLAGALPRAVCDEPNFKYMIPNEQARVRFQTAFFGIVAGAGQLRGEVLTGQDGNSAAVWIRCDGAFALASVVRMAIRTTPRQWSWPDLKR